MKSFETQDMSKTLGKTGFGDKAQKKKSVKTTIITDIASTQADSKGY
jgi:hypothetical protein